MRRFEGKTVVISGGARGQGRSHAVRFAREGAAVVAFDICAQIEAQPIPMSTVDDLAETESLVAAQGAAVLTAVADVRDAGRVTAVFADAVERFGGIDVVVANAGIVGAPALSWETDDVTFRDVVDVNLTGTWNTVTAGVRAMLAGNRLGSIVITGSGASVMGLPNLVPYVAAKHALVGVVRTMAKELGPRGIRINAVLPGNVNTPMFDNDYMHRIYVPESKEADRQTFLGRATAHTPLRIPYVEPDDVSDAVLYLASEQARYVTGSLFPIDGGSGVA